MLTPRPGIDPFLGPGMKVTDTEGLKAIETILELPKGVIVTGRLIDKATGQACPCRCIALLQLPTNRNEG